MAELDAWAEARLALVQHQQVGYSSNPQDYIRDGDNLAGHVCRLLNALDTVTAERDALRAEVAEIHHELGELLGVTAHWLERDPTTPPLATIRALWERTAAR